MASEQPPHPPAVGPTIQAMIRAAKGDRAWWQLEDDMPIDPATGRHSPGEKMLQRTATRGPEAWTDPATMRSLAQGLRNAGVTCADSDVIDAYTRALGFRIAADDAVGPLVIVLGELGRSLTWEEAQLVAPVIIATIKARRSGR